MKKHIKTMLLLVAAVAILALAMAACDSGTTGDAEPSSPGTGNPGTENPGTSNPGGGGGGNGGSGGGGGGGGGGGSSSIGTDGELTVGGSETLSSTLTVTATSVADPTKSGAATVTVSATTSVPISITVTTQPTKSLTPMEDGAYDELTDTFKVTVSNLMGTDTVDVDLAAAYGLTLQGGPVAIGNGTRTLTLEYDGTTPGVAYPDLANVGLAVTVLAPYSFAGSPAVEVGIYDGAVAGRPIPVNQANIAHFNAYARMAGATGGLDKHYKLAGNISLSGTWTAIGDNTDQFTGSFDGDGHKISNLSINLPAVDYQGLFGYINNATVKNLGLESVNVTGARYAGSLVGYANLSGTYKVENCYAAGSVKGTRYIGGLVGENYGTIVNCYSAVDINSSDSISYAGGIVGYNSGAAAKVTFCYATGTIVCTGTDVGGIEGFGGKATNCVALNPSITAPSTSFLGRVSGSTGGADNYANDLMDDPGAGSFGVAANKDGEDVSSGAGGYNDDTWWETVSPGGPDWSFAPAGTGNDTDPWEWDMNNNLPKLWFE